MAGASRGCTGAHIGGALEGFGAQMGGTLRGCTGARWEEHRGFVVKPTWIPD